MKIKCCLILLVIFIIMSCSNQNDNLVELQRHVESLEKKLADSYKPGFGEFMSGIQLHHIKLWFAGQQHNWKLADFEIHEIMEAIDDIQKYDTDRKETRKISMILAPIDSINNAIKNQNEVMFKRSFTLLTNTCNNCHRSNEFEFNVVKIPEVNPFSNQDFRVNEGK